MPGSYAHTKPRPWPLGQDKIPSGPFTLSEQNIYGSSREGAINQNKRLDTATIATTVIYNLIGDKQYQHSNHLGNVLATVSDVPVADNGGSGSVTLRFKPDYLSGNVYSSFGVPLEDTDLNWGTYRYGFNGMEKDDEMKGNGNSYDFGARMYDPRLGRFLCTDKYKSRFGYQSPYIFAGNTPIQAIDNNGDSVWVKSNYYANLIKDDLNKIYSDKYGESGKSAFKTHHVIEYYCMGFKVPEEKLKSLTEEQINEAVNSGFFGKRDITYIVPNEEFDWNKDEYTKEMYIQLKSSNQTEVKTINNPKMRPTEGKADFGSITLNFANLESFAGFQKYQSKWSIGAVFMHELLYHKSPTGLSDMRKDKHGSEVMRIAYGTRTGQNYGNDLHKGGNFIDPISKKERSSIEKERLKTGNK